MAFVRTLTILALAGAAPMAVRAADVAPGRAVVHVKAGTISPIAIRRIQDRISDAALDVCGAPASSLSEVKRSVRGSACWRDAYAGAVAQLRAISPRTASIAPAAPSGMGTE